MTNFPVTGAFSDKVRAEVTEKFGVTMSDPNWYKVYWRWAHLVIRQGGVNGSTPTLPPAVELPPLEIEVRPAESSSKPQNPQRVTPKLLAGCTITSEVGEWRASPNADGSFSLTLTIPRAPRSILLSLQGQAFAILCPGEQS